MSSSYFGEPNMGNERGSGGSSSSSSRKGKKNNSDKPKQPQRGLGVAQLEKIRLTGQMCHPSLQTPYSSNFSNEFCSTSSTIITPPDHASDQDNMGLGEYERANIRYGDSQPTSTARWDPSNAYTEAQQYVQQPNMTRHLLNLHVEDSQHMKGKKHRSNSMGSSSQNSETSDTQELDLELRLSL
ncbi:hypothetical protein FEM48_Zijuj12G0038300 [Ziziphus jujuba var. spinosa]|uniref:Protein SPEAR3-like n=1 Tax=Ziziphus jujuba var. spinosa TaxID=714518 RepID=A0A978UB07_ZIZJJ|nr:hypothetical protein FEM48_Zijuj12G0038300 [Ziziphus jujuba var. spinosa]